jgi:Rrf2 family protein
MLFNQTAEYALRAMSCLVTHENAGWLSSDDLAGATQIPVQYVPKVMRPLAQAGLVEARRGRKGGFRLARHPEEIRLSDVLRAAGVLPDPEHCAFGLPRCNPLEPCPLHGSWSKLGLAVDAWAYGTTLADLQRAGGTAGALPASATPKPGGP